ncbi:hypothetical protein [Streptomyces albicerus]|uniref:hypothetical protein n=1 Tax=Streptomyces albicerus TaxID=2569859 RepID=UPI00124AE4E1|nr:hypothetical protein [Streptomyces albicerus]
MSSSRACSMTWARRRICALYTRYELGIAYQVLMGSSARLPDGDSANTRVAAFAALTPHRVQA